MEEALWLFWLKMGQNKGMPIASKEVIKAYFKANPTIKKFYNIPLAFLDLI